MLISVRLRMQGEFLEAQTITSILGVPPNLVRAKGEVTTTTSGKRIVAKAGRWEWYSEDPANVLSINEHLLKMKVAFGPALFELARLPGVDNAWVDVNMVTVDGGADAQVTFLLSQDSVETLHQIGLPVEFSIYTLGRDDNE